MPVNPKLQPVTLPMKLKFGQKPTTEFHNNIEAIGVELIDHPTRQQACDLAWHFVKSTWADKPDIEPVDFDDKTLSKNLEDVFGGRTLPAPMECLGFTFKISGISTQIVTHILRHRAATFAAQCTGDRDLRDDPAVVPESVENSPEFHTRWLKIVEDAKQLYADMSDSKKVSMMDARIILPKCMESFYYMRMPLKDLIGFLWQRKDIAIQPAEDNIIAIKMAVEIAKVIPEFASVVDFEKPDMHYVKTFRVKDGDKWVSRGTNLYWPAPRNDIFEFHPQDSIYQCTREELNGTHGVGPQKKFTVEWKKGINELKEIQRKHEAWKNS